MTPPRTYTGIGARATPPDALALMRALAVRLAEEGWMLRTGGAAGADSAFQMGADDGGGASEVYLPWPGFRGATDAVLRRPSPRAFDLAASHHPAWSSCGRAARALHARNSHQVLGRDLETPSAFVVCWTADGSLDGVGRRSGGTGQALRLATSAGVPVFNLRRAEARERVEAFLLARRS